MDVTVQVRTARFAYPTGSPRLTLAAGLGCILIAAAFVLVRAAAPSDGTQLVIDPGRPVMDTVVIRPDGGDASGFESGDLLGSLGGRSVDDVLGATLGTGVPALTESGSRHTYRVIRAQAPLDVSVAVASRSILGPLSLDVPLYAYLIFNMIVGTIVFVKRPERSSARMFFRFAASFTAAETIYFLSFSATDLARAWFVPLATAANAALFYYTFSAALHFALTFPRVHPLLARRPGRVLLAVYAGPWLLSVLVFAADPGALAGFVQAWLRTWQVTSYVGAMMLVLILAAFIAAFRRIETSADRRQLRWIMWGTGIAVIPWAAGLAISLVTPLHIREAMPVLALSFAAIPTTVAIAIVRERMFDIDLIVNRTLVYILLSAILAGVYAASVSLVQRAFIAITGAESDGAIVVATLIIVVVFAPIRDALQRLVDRRFKGLPPHALRLRELGDHVARRLTPVHPESACRRLAETVVDAYGAGGAAIHLVGPHGKSSTAQVGQGYDAAALQIELVATSGERVGLLDLGPRLDGRPYARDERELIAEIAGIVADAIVADRPMVAPARHVQAGVTG